MGAVRLTTPGSGSYTLPSSNITRVWVSCVGGGGGSLGGIISEFWNYVTPIGGGGGGWGYSSVAISNLTFNYTVGSGGAGSNTSPSDGGTSACLGISGFGGLGAKTTNIITPSGNIEIPGGSFSASNGQNGQSGFSINTAFFRARGGGAGGTVSTVCVGNDGQGDYKSNYDIIGETNPDISIGNVVSTFLTCSGGYADVTGGTGPNTVVASGGGNGNDGTGTTVTGELGSISPINQTFIDDSGDFVRIVGVTSTAIGGNGIYGGGGSPSTGGNWSDTFQFVAVSSYVQGNGGSGVVYVSWIDLTANKTTLRSGEPTTVFWSSPVDSGSETVSYTNTGTTSITQTYTRTDSRGAQSAITFTILPAVRITSFTANPNPQTSGLDGVPNYDTTLSWTLNGDPPLTYTLTSGTFSESGSTGLSGGTTVTNLPQSVTGSNSPATKTYTLTVTDGFSTATSSVTVSVTNDNTPDNFTVPDQTNVQPSTPITIQVGPITGIDMVTNVTGGPGVSVSNNNFTFSSSTTIQNNGIFYVRVTSLPFNTDPNGLTNSSTYSVTVGTVQRFFTVTTRAPDVNETFNFSNKDDYVPTPDIDTIPDPDADIRNQANLYIVSDTLLIDDIELGNPTGVEIKTNNPNAQIRVKRSGSSTFENWQDVRSI